MKKQEIIYGLKVLGCIALSMAFALVALLLMIADSIDYTEAVSKL